MKITILFVTAVVALGGSMLYKKHKANEAHEVLSAIRIEWNNAFALAQSTPRVSLAEQIARLQSIESKLNRIEVPECYALSKFALQKEMSAAATELLNFLRLNESETKRYAAIREAYSGFNQLGPKCFDSEKEDFERRFLASKEKSAHDIADFGDKLSRIPLIR